MAGTEADAPQFALRSRGTSRVAGGEAMAGSGVSLGVSALGAALAAGCLFCALRAGRKRRLLDDLPSSKTTGVFMGLVELRGTAEAEAPLESYLAAARCVAYHWEVEESWSRQVSETTTDSAGRSRTTTHTESGWTTVAQGGEEIPFYLKDDCGVIRVQPQGAKLEPQTVFDRTVGRGDPLYYEKGPAGAVPNSDHRRRFVERAVPLHAALLVVGQAREREDVVAAEIAADRNAPMFLISTRSEKQVSRGLRLGAWLLGALGVVVSVGGLVARDLLAHRPPGPDAPLFVGVGMVYLFLWLLGWTWMAYNSLIELRQRVRQAWANVEVQLERRHELIPNLVAIVGGLRDHERRAQAELAALRAQLAVTPPGEPGPDPSGCLPALRAVAEAYPELKASANFLRLQQQLAETEQRIALARSYFNDIATLYNTRLQVMPDRFVATIARQHPRALMAAAGFDRAPVAVSLSA